MKTNPDTKLHVRYGFALARGISFPDDFNLREFSIDSTRERAEEEIFNKVCLSIINVIAGSADPDRYEDDKQREALILEYKKRLIESFLSQ